MSAASPPPVADADAAATLHYTVLQFEISVLTLVLGVVAAGIGLYQYLQSLRRDRIKATNDAIEEAAQLDLAYSKVLRIPNLLAEENGRRYYDYVSSLDYELLTDAEQAELNVVWDTATSVNNYFARAKALLDAKYFNAQLFLDRLDAFTMVAFAIVYPAYNRLCRRKGFDAGRFRAVAERAQVNLRSKQIDNDLSNLDLQDEAYL